jgi:hypothetical protein
MQKPSKAPDLPNRRMPEHSHCPHDCEHPQPFKVEGIEFCGRCWFRFGVKTMMVPCTPDICGD